MTVATAKPEAALRGRRSRSALRDGALIALITVLVAAALWTARHAPWTPGSDPGYWLGVAAGVALLSLFLYPLRKRWSVAQRWGRSRRWFAAHMALGIAAPLLAIVHSRLEFGSPNATIAFVSMALVAASGVVGRFLYARIHAGLYGAATDVRALTDEVARQIGALRAGGELDPELDAILAKFVLRAERAGAGGLRHPLRFLMLGADRTVATIRARRRVAVALAAQALAAGADRETLARRAARKRFLVSAYLRGVQRLAQFRAYQRLFSWWHVLHVPLVWMLVATVIAHVVAVHMY